MCRATARERESYAAPKYGHAVTNLVKLLTNLGKDSAPLCF